MRKLVIALSLLAAVLLSFSGVFDNEAMYGRIHADAQGYYGYLVATFIEHSFNWQEVIQPYADTYFNGTAADFTVQSEHGRINKYYAGTAVLIMPFFLLSCVAAWLFGFPVDGYSAPFQLGIVFSALFYAGVGMYYLSKFLERKGISKSIALFSVVAGLFGTGLFHYSISEAAMSHVYSFGLVSLFMYRVDKWLQNANRSDLIWSSLVFGLIVLVRPVNGLIIFSVPFFAGGIAPLVDRLKSNQKLVKQLGLGLALVFAVLLVQVLMYLAQVGKPLVWSYQDEGFNFLNPEILNVLFSYKKGFFIYTPLAGVGLIGLMIYLCEKPKQAVWLWLFLGLVIYVISCWWNWYYGASFGHRAMIEYLPFFIFGAAYLIQQLVGPARVTILALCSFFVYLNLVQSYQYQKFILHWDGMSKERYWEVFMKTDREYDGIFYRQKQELVPIEEQEIIETVTFESDLEEGTTWGSQGFTTEKAFSGVQSTRINSESKYGTTLGVPAKEIGITGRKQLRITAMVWSERTFPSLSIAYSYRREEGDYGHEYIGIGQLISKKKEWVKVEHLVPISLALNENHTWVVYPISDDEGTIYLDDIRYEIMTLKE